MRAAKVGGVELSTSSKFTEVKSPMMEFDCGCKGRRLNKVRLIVNRGFLLQMASTSAVAASKVPTGVDWNRAAFSFSVRQTSGSTHAERRLNTGRAIDA